MIAKSGEVFVIENGVLLRFESVELFEKHVKLEYKLNEMFTVEVEMDGVVEGYTQKISNQLRHPEKIVMAILKIKDSKKQASELQRFKKAMEGVKPE